MSWSNVVNMKTNKSTRVFKEGFEYTRNSEPIDVFHREIKELDPVIDKNFIIEVTLLVDEMSNPFEKKYFNVESVFGVNNEVLYKNETYSKNVNARDIISYILNDRTFYTNTYNDADRLHRMLYTLINKINMFNSSMGVKPIGNPTIIEQIKNYIIKLESDKSFIVKTRINEAKQESRPFSFFKNKEEKIMDKHVENAGGMAGVMNNRASRFDLGTSNGRVFMK